MRPPTLFARRWRPLLLVALVLFVSATQPASALYSDDVYVALSNGERFVEPAQPWSTYFCSLQEICMLADVNGDGRDDAVAFVRTNHGADDSDVWVALSTGSGFGPRQKWHEYFCTLEEICATGDINGDGRDDVIAFVRTNHGANDSDVWVALSTGSGFGPAQKWHDYFCTLQEICKVGDANGDGRDDVIAFVRTNHGTNDSDVWVALSTGSGFGPGQKWHDHFCTLQELCEVGDLDDDGDDDIVAFVRSTNSANDGDVWFARSSGSAYGAGQKGHESFCTQEQICAVADVTGEGYADAIAFVRTNHAATDSDIYVATNLGPAFDPAPDKWAEYHCTLEDICAVGDVNGDGLDDAVSFTRTRVPGPQQPVSVDVMVSLYRSVSTPQERLSYEEIFRHFADGIFEMTNGAHRVTSVTVYQNRTGDAFADVVWTASAWPSADLSGRFARDMNIKMADIFTFSTPYLALQSGNERGAGYTLAHEFGHYWYGLEDEYQGDAACDDKDAFDDPQTCDVDVPHSVMTDQWNAHDLDDFRWLNVSIPSNQTSRNAHRRVYGASGWEVLRRSPKDDPKDGERKNNRERIHYPELATVAPTGNLSSTLEMPTSEGRGKLLILWKDRPSIQVAPADTSDYLASVYALEGERISYPRTVSLVATLRKNNELIARADVSATVTVNGVTEPLAFRDDGIAPDEEADDGLYSAILPYRQNGNHRVDVIFRNTSGQAAFTFRHHEYTPGPNGERFVPQPQPVGEPFEHGVATTVLVLGHPGADTSPPPTTITLDNSDFPGRIDAPGDVERFAFTVAEAGPIMVRVTDRALGMEPVLRLFAGTPPVLVAEQARPEPGAAYSFVRVNAQTGDQYLVEVTHARADAAEGFFNVSAGASITSDTTTPSGGQGRLYLPLVTR